MMLVLVTLQQGNVALLLSFLALLVLITTVVQAETHATAVVPAYPDLPQIVLLKAPAFPMESATPRPDNATTQ